MWGYMQVYVCEDICMCIYVRIYASVSMWGYMHVYICEDICKCMYVRIHTCVCMGACLYNRCQAI